MAFMGENPQFAFAEFPLRLLFEVDANSSREYLEARRRRGIVFGKPGASRSAITV